MTDHTNRAELEARQMRSDVFAALRRHDASDDLFAEIAAITHHYIAALPLAPLAQRGMTEQEIEALAKECVGSVKGLYFDSSSCQHSHRAFQSARLVSRATLSRVPVAGWPGEDFIEGLAHGIATHVSDDTAHYHFIVAKKAALEMARRLRAHMPAGSKMVPVTLPSESEANIDAYAEPQWIDWHGGKCPVPAGTRVEVQLRDSTIHKVDPSFVWWVHYGNTGDIIAYRITDGEQQAVAAAMTDGGLA